MGRPPSNGAPSFRFHPSEVAQMDAILRKHEGHVPPRDLLVALADRFSNSPERAGKIAVQMKQVWNWFQNRRYALRAKLVKPPEKPNTSSVTRDEITPMRSVPLTQPMAVSAGPYAVRNTSEASSMEFEARSSRDGAWYDVQEFLSHRYLETGNPEVLVRFSGFGQNEDEWVNIRKHARQRSLPCEASECIVVLPGDLILCFQEGKEQALYFDAHVLDAQRRRHDVRGCRCRFLVRYDHDQSEEIVPLRKICRRPETDYRLQQQHTPYEAVAPSRSVSMEPPIPVVDLTNTTSQSPTSGVGPYVQPQAPTPSQIKPPTTSSVWPPTTSAIGPPAPTPSPIPAVTPVSVLSPAAPVHTSVSAPVTIAVTETSALVPEQKKVEDNNSDCIQVLVTESNKIKTDNPAFVPEPTQPSKIEMAPASVPIETNSPAPVSVPEPIKIENDIPNTLPEQNQAESINLGTSDVEAGGAHANFKHPTEANKVLEAKNAETSDLNANALAENSVFQSQPNSNPVIEVLGQEKVDSSSLLPVTENVSTVSAESTVISEELKE
ncbi:hypothetical protein vseg_011119 [Gypsophila vaccaria]